MSKLTTSLEALRAAYDAFSTAEEASGLPEQQKPSALLLTFDPLRNPNAGARITGDPEALVEVLRFAMNDNEVLREALTNLLPELLDRA